MKPFSEACERNQNPILSIIKPLLKDKANLLEIGSGTGQHAVYFSESMPHIIWQTSDQKENHEGINRWVDESALNNILSPIELDVMQEFWTSKTFDAVYSANTAHIMSWVMVEAFFKGVGLHLNDEGLFILYGPFNYAGKFTSESNQAFEGWLKSIDEKRGIRDFEAVNLLAKQSGMILVSDYEMPSNNRILVWQKL